MCGKGRIVTNLETNEYDQKHNLQPCILRERDNLFNASWNIAREPNLVSQEWYSAAKTQANERTPKTLPLIAHSSQNVAVVSLPVTHSNAKRYSKFFHLETWQQMCRKILKIQLHYLVRMCSTFLTYSGNGPIFAATLYFCCNCCCSSEKR